MTITLTDKITRDFFLGFIRLHILFHASVQPVFGLNMIRELETHGYHLSPGTLYPILHGLERDGFLESTKRWWMEKCASITAVLHRVVRHWKMPWGKCASCLMKSLKAGESLVHSKNRQIESSRRFL